MQKQEFNIVFFTISSSDFYLLRIILTKIELDNPVAIQQQDIFGTTGKISTKFGRKHWVKVSL